VESGRNGWLISAGDEEALLGAMRDAALMPVDELREMGRRARESVSAYTLRNGATRFVDYARQVVSQW